MIQFKRRYFPERKYRPPLRWVLWGMVALLFLIFAVFMKMLR
jgi:hypothetical protein